MEPNCFYHIRTQEVTLFHKIINLSKRNASMAKAQPSCGSLPLNAAVWHNLFFMLHIECSDRKMEMENTSWRETFLKFDMRHSSILEGTCLLHGMLSDRRSRHFDMRHEDLPSRAPILMLRFRWIIHFFHRIPPNGMHNIRRRNGTGWKTKFNRGSNHSFNPLT